MATVATIICVCGSCGDHLLMVVASTVMCVRAKGLPIFTLSRRLAKKYGVAANTLAVTSWQALGMHSTTGSLTLAVVDPLCSKCVTGELPASS